MFELGLIFLVVPTAHVAFMPVVHRLPAFCPRHGIFPSPIAISGFVEGSFRGNKVTCPVCGRLSTVVSGDYTAMGDLLTIAVDDSVSKEALDALIALAHTVAVGDIDETEAEKRAVAISPRFKGLFSGLTLDNKVTLAAALITAVASLSNLGGGDTIINNPAPIVTVIRDGPTQNTYAPLPYFGPILQSHPLTKRLRNSTSNQRIPLPVPRPKTR